MVLERTPLRLLLINVLIGVAMTLTSPASIGATAIDDGCTRLELHDGRTLEGRVLDESLREIEFEVHVGSIRSTVTIKLHEIKSRTAIDCAAEPPAPDVDPEPTRPNVEFVPAERFMLIRIDGPIGIDPEVLDPESITATGVREALNRARRANIRHIVFEIDSPGGYVHEAREIARVLDELGDHFTYHAVVRRCLSGAMYVLLSADHRYVVNGESRSTPAVAYTNHRPVGETIVDDRLSASITAELAERGAARDFPEPVIRAMLVQSAELWLDEQALVPRLAAASAGPNWTSLDDRNSVFTLDAETMTRLRLAEPVASVLSVGRAIGVEKFEQWGDRGDAAVANETGDTIELITEIREACTEAIADSRSLAESVDDIRQARYIAMNRDDPSPYNYEHSYESGQFTPAGRARWRADIDRAIDGWRRVYESADNVLDARDDAERAIKDAGRARLQGEWLDQWRERRIAEVQQAVEALEPDAVQVEAFRAEAAREISRLRDLWKRRGVR